MERRCPGETVFDQKRKKRRKLENDADNKREGAQAQLLDPGEVYAASFFTRKLGKATLHYMMKSSANYCMHEKEGSSPELWLIRPLSPSPTAFGRDHPVPKDRGTVLALNRCILMLCF